MLQSLGRTAKVTAFICDGVSLSAQVRKLRDVYRFTLKFKRYYAMSNLIV